jgi:glycosyltransferase involved in cell wall biosynthesis
MIISNYSKTIGQKPEILRNENYLGEQFSTNKINPKLSIISCSMNLGQFLEDTILSVARQTYKNFEHIVIDGASTDNTLDILKKYPHLTWISEKDSGYVEGLRKGLAMAKGEYIMQCAVSDGYIDKDWFKKCIELLESNKDVSLVWGFPQYLTEDGILGEVSYPQFHGNDVPNRSDFFKYWMNTFFWLPEGNFCVRSKVFKHCFPETNNRDVEPYLEFNYRFHKYGYLTHNIPSIASYGRIHSNQLGQRWQDAGLGKIKYENYISKCKNYRNKHLLINTKVFIDKEYNEVSKIKVKRQSIVKELSINTKTIFISLIKRIFNRIPFNTILKSLFRKYNFLKEFRKLSHYSERENRFDFKWIDRQPCLSDNTGYTAFDRHYVYHPAWAARIVAETKPIYHVDISSSLHFCSIISAFIPVRFYDYRPANLHLSNLETNHADLINLNFESNSIVSISCMHTVEHIGLGRYGDPLDYNGDLKAMAELARVLAIGGYLLFVVPIGNKSFIQFNAHRIYTKEHVVNQFKRLGLNLKEFTLIPEIETDGGLINNPPQELLNKQRYACGCFLFTKYNKTIE